MRRRRGGAASLRVVLAIEDVLHALLVELVGLLGRREITVLPFIGYGTPEQVRARGRVVLGRRIVGSAAGDLVRTAGPSTAGPGSAGPGSARPGSARPGSARPGSVVMVGRGRRGCGFGGGRCGSRWRRS